MATRASPWATGHDGFGRTQWEGPEEGSSLSSPVPSRLTRSLPPHCAAPTRLPLATARLDAHVPQSLGETPPGETLQGASRGGAGLGPPTEGEPSSERRGRRRGKSSGRAVGEGRSSTSRPQGSEGGQRMRSDPMGGAGAGEPVHWDPRAQVSPIGRWARRPSALTVWIWGSRPQGGTLERCPGGGAGAVRLPRRGAAPPRPARRPGAGRSWRRAGESGSVPVDPRTGPSAHRTGHVACVGARGAAGPASRSGHASPRGLLPPRRAARFTLQEVFAPRSGGGVTPQAGPGPESGCSPSSNPGPPQLVPAAKSLDFSVPRLLHLQNTSSAVRRPRAARPTRRTRAGRLPPVPTAPPPPLGRRRRAPPSRTQRLPFQVLSQAGGRLFPLREGSPQAVPTWPCQLSPLCGL